MKINSLNFNYNAVNNSRPQNKYAQNPYIERISGGGNHFRAKFNTLNYAANFLPFTGGYSLDLAKTVEMLDGKMPPGVQEMAEMVLEEGNPDNLTLIDIHKMKYGKINQLKSIAEVKKEYPEFDDVLSDRQTDYVKNSFIDDVKNDRLEWFDSETDLALQLLQMYWADGFSLNDLKEYSDGKNIDSAMNKFNIPKLDRQYAFVLKLSDKEYNERFTAEMSERLKGVERKRDIKKYGVYIPRGPMSDEQKQAVSEGLAKYWAEHPEKKEEASDRMKQYYKEHPEEAARMKKALILAWNLKDAQKLRKKMSKFMGREDISAEEFAKMDMDGTGFNGKTLKDFWNRNPWAKTAWSAYLTKGWEKLKKLEAKETLENKPKADFVVTIYPAPMVRDMRHWFKKNGYDVSKMTDIQIQATYKDKPEIQRDEYTHNAVSAYFEAHDENLRADMLQVALFSTFGDIVKKYPLNSPNTSDYVKTICRVLASEIFQNNMPKVLTTQNALDIYTDITLACLANNKRDIVEILEKNLEDAYFAVTNRDTKAAIKAKDAGYRGLNALRSYNINIAAQNTVSKPSNNHELKFSKPKEGKEDFVCFEVYSPSLKAEMIERIKGEGIDFTGKEEVMGAFFDLNSLPSGPFGNQKIIETLNSYCHKNIDFANFVANTHLITSLSTAAELKEAGYEGEKGQVASDIYNYVDEQICDKTTGFSRKFGSRKLLNIYTNCVEYCYDKNQPEFARKFEENLEASYHKIKKEGAQPVLSDILDNHYWTNLD